MVTIIKRPPIKKVKYFKCICGCEFTAESEDYALCLSTNKDFGYYTIDCPYCHCTRIFPYNTVKEIEVDIE